MQEYYDGIILKGIGGFYYVKSNSIVYECKARGIFKKRKITPLVGDKVKISILSEDEKLGVIEEISPRKLELLRPSVANVDQAIIVFAVKSPEPNINLLDKILALCEYTGLEAVLCFNKFDLLKAGEFDNIFKIYEDAGYKVLKTSTLINNGIDELISVLDGKISVFAGPSGVGKSSILNEIQPGLKLKTGAISDKIKRGKHTTRHSELIELVSGGWVVDTPGFTSLEINFVEIGELDTLFKEFREYNCQCKFNNCVHMSEPGCAVIEALNDGMIHPSRYESYKYFYNQISEHRRYKSW